MTKLNQERSWQGRSGTWAVTHGQRPSADYTEVNADLHPAIKHRVPFGIQIVYTPLGIANSELDCLLVVLQKEERKGNRRQ